MLSPRLVRSVARLAQSALALCLGSALLLSCSKEATPSPEQPAANTASGEESSLASGEAKPSYSETGFQLTLSPEGDYEKGKAGSAQIVLEAKPPFHANDKYPYKLRLADAPGVSYPEKIVTKDKAKVEHTKVTMPVAFTATEAGKRRIGGIFQFSVCTEDKCLIEKRNLALDIDVK